MGKLHNTVGEAERIYREMRALAQSGDTEGKRRIVQLRSRYAMQMLEIMREMKADERLQKKPELAKEFESRFFEMRQALAQHQGKWRSANIDEDSAGYRRATDELGRKQDDFYTWAKDTLSGL